MRSGISAGAAGQDPEERLDVGVGGGVTVAVEVGLAAGGAAVAGEAGEEGFDVEVGAGVAVVVEVGRARQGEGGRAAGVLAAGVGDGAVVQAGVGAGGVEDGEGVGVGAVDARVVVEGSAV